MPYNKQTFQVGDIVTAEWANKLEDNLERVWHFRGAINTKDNLPTTDIEPGDMYVVIDKAKIYVWNGEKWVEIGGGQGMNYVLDDNELTLYPTVEDVDHEVPVDPIDGSNTTFNFYSPPIEPGSFVLYEISQGSWVDNEVPSGTIDGSNKTFTLSNSPILPKSVVVVYDAIDQTNLSDYTGQVDGSNKKFTTDWKILQGSLSVQAKFLVKYTEIPNGQLDGTNKNFKLSHIPIRPFTVEISADGNLITDDGNGNLSDGGTINYDTGEFSLNAAPSQLSANYMVLEDKTVTDNGNGILSDGGYIDYEAKEVIFANPPLEISSWSYSSYTTLFIKDNGNGNLSDGGTIDYSNGTINLNSAPKTTIKVTYFGGATYTQVTDNGDGTLSDGGTINYDTAQVVLNTAPSDVDIQAYYRRYFVDGLKWESVMLLEDFPQTAEIAVQAEASQGNVEFVFQVLDAYDNVLAEAPSQQLTQDGQSYTLVQEIDLSSAPRPQLAFIQLSYKASHDTQGILKAVEMRWY